MKQFIFLAVLCCSAAGAFSQTNEGVVIYERKINMHRRIQDEQMRAMIPEFRTSKHQLFFSDSTSVYKTLPEDEMPESFSSDGGGGTRVFRMGGGENAELFRNFAEGRSLEARELGAKNFIIEDSIRRRNWKLTGETKVILGYTCRKAVGTEKMVTGPVRMVVSNNGNTNADTTTKRPEPKEVIVEAWYAEGLNAPVGPDSYGMLPGAILELNIDNGAVAYTALEVKKTVDRKDIKEPKKGKKVTRDEFMKMQMELMGGPGGGGMRMIRM